MKTNNKIDDFLIVQITQVSGLECCILQIFSVKFLYEK